MGTRAHEWLMPAAWSDRFRLIFVDLRGSGESTGDPRDLTFDLLASDLEAVRQTAGAERVAVFGWSILGALAIEYGRRRPASVSRVITAGAPPFGDMSRMLASATAFFEADASEERRRLLRENMARLPEGASPGQALRAQAPMRFFDAAFDIGPMLERAISKPAFFQHALGPMTAGWDAAAAAPGAPVPIFLGHGRYDYVVPHVLWQGVAEKLPGAVFRLFERSGHQPFFEEPDLFLRSVTEWMDAAR
jgi:proline iminopeptidase